MLVSKRGGLRQFPLRPYSPRQFPLRPYTHFEEVQGAPARGGPQHSECREPSRGRRWRYAAGIVAGAHEDALSNAAHQDLHWIRGGTVTMRRLSAALLVLAPLTLAACSTLSVESEAHLLQPAPAVTRTLVVVELSGASRREI